MSPLVSSSELTLHQTGHTWCSVPSQDVMARMQKQVRSNLLYCLEQFSKITRAKEKDRTSVKFQRKTTHSHNFNARLLTAKLDCPDHNSQLTYLTLMSRLRTLFTRLLTAKLDCPDHNSQLASLTYEYSCIEKQPRRLTKLLQQIMLGIEIFNLLLKHRSYGPFSRGA